MFFHGGCGDTRELYCRCIVYKPAIPGQFKRLPVSKIIDNLIDYLCYNEMFVAVQEICDRHI